jgi:F0F1-type ATP synthase membrane subunit b/b'
MLRNRTEEIRRALEDSEAEKRRAGEKLEEARARLANLASEVDAVKKAAEAEGRAEQEGIRRLAAEEAEKIRRLAKADMEAQVRAGILALKRHAASLAAERALERIRGRLTPETHTVLIERSIGDLAASDEKKGPDPKVRPGAH